MKSKICIAKSRWACNRVKVSSETAAKVGGWGAYSGIGGMNFKNIWGAVCWGTGIMRGTWEEQPLLICVPFTRNIKVVRFGPTPIFFFFFFCQFFVSYRKTDSAQMEQKTKQNKKRDIFSPPFSATADNVGAFCARCCACWVIFSGGSLFTSVRPH